MTTAFCEKRDLVHIERSTSPINEGSGPYAEIRLVKVLFFSGEFPHLVLITWDGAIGTTIVCTGSLLSEKAVITAAHCCRVAELGSLSSGAKMAMKIFVKRVFTIFATNVSFLCVIANLQI